MGDWPLHTSRERPNHLVFPYQSMLFLVATFSSPATKMLDIPLPFPVIFGRDPFSEEPATKIILDWINTFAAKGRGLPPARDQNRRRWERGFRCVRSPYMGERPAREVVEIECDAMGDLVGVGSQRQNGRGRREVRINGEGCPKRINRFRLS